MNPYRGQHKFCCGIDLHARRMYLCIVDEKGEICYGLWLFLFEPRLPMFPVLCFNASPLR
jgi:hypothetical protein